MRISIGIFLRCFLCILFTVFCQLVSAAEGVITSSSAGAYVTSEKYGLLSSIGQPTAVETVSSATYSMMPGFVPSTQIRPTWSPPDLPAFTRNSDELGVELNAANLASLLGVRDPDGTDLTFHITSLAGQLKQDGVLKDTATVSRTNSANWSPTGQSGNIYGFSVILGRGIYPNSEPVKVIINVADSEGPIEPVQERIFFNPDFFPLNPTIDLAAGNLLVNSDTLKIEGAIEATGNLMSTDSGRQTAIFSFEDINIGSDVIVNFSGNNPVALISRNDIRLDGKLLLNGASGNTKSKRFGGIHGGESSIGGAAGGYGGTNAKPGEGRGGGNAPGGGASHATFGAFGNNNGSKSGSPGNRVYNFIPSTIDMIGGSGGAGGQDDLWVGSGGAGGGALQLRASNAVVLGENSLISMDGGHGGNAAAGGGGGSGGTLIGKAMNITHSGIISAKGGKGGNKTGEADRFSGKKVAGENFGEVTAHPNQEAKILGTLTINDEPAEPGDVLAIYVGDELRGKTYALVFQGAALFNLPIQTADANESATFMVYDASAKELFDVSGFSITISPGNSLGSFDKPVLINATGKGASSGGGGSGGTVVFSSENIDNKGTIDLAGGQNGYIDASHPAAAEGIFIDDGIFIDTGSPGIIEILTFTRKPFGFDFHSQAGKGYFVEYSQDLKNWVMAKTYKGTGDTIRFEDQSIQPFQQVYFRLKLAE